MAVIAIVFRLPSPDLAAPAAMHALSRGAAPNGDGFVWRAGREDSAVRAASAIAKCGGGVRVGVHAAKETAAALAGARALAEGASPGRPRVTKAVERGVPRMFRFLELPAIEVPTESLFPYELLDAVPGAGEFEDSGEDAPAALPDGPVLLTGRETSRRRASAALRRAARSAGLWSAGCRCATGARFPLETFAGLAWDEAGVSGLDRGDALRVARRVVRDLDDEEAAWAVARSPGTGGEAARVAWSRWLGARGPGLICVEDCDVADAESLSLLEDLAALPGLVRVATGPEGAGAPQGFRAVALPAPAAADPDAARAVASLSPETREVLAAGATVGRSFWMMFVSRMLAGEVAEALAEARSAGCLVARPDSLMQADGQWMFPTAAMRAAVLGMEDGSRRDALNESAAQLYGRLAKFGGPHLADLERFHRTR